MTFLTMQNRVLVSTKT